ncbi:MAG: hypothetical protein JXA25_16740 [Anaerolineales bacterium]|nr:hypothetical protein [Anaerolineales bacterium]
MRKRKLTHAGVGLLKREPLVRGCGFLRDPCLASAVCCPAAERSQAARLLLVELV